MCIGILFFHWNFDIVSMKILYGIQLVHLANLMAIWKGLPSNLHVKIFHETNECDCWSKSVINSGVQTKVLIWRVNIFILASNWPVLKFWKTWELDFAFNPQKLHHEGKMNLEKVQSSANHKYIIEGEVEKEKQKASW